MRCLVGGGRPKEGGGGLWVREAGAKSFRGGCVVGRLIKEASGKVEGGAHGLTQEALAIM
jgi:hypothetical protein